MIDSFRGENRFLSNFWPALVEYDGMVYPTVEHAYQAAKTNDKTLRGTIRNLLFPGGAKKFVRKLVLDGKIVIKDDWEIEKTMVMEELVRKKFSNPTLRKMLLETGEQELVEDNNWGDTFWGKCDGVGHNRLGKILMKVREEVA